MGEKRGVNGSVLNRKGYYASYNIAFDPFIYEMSGAEKLYEQYISENGMEWMDGKREKWDGMIGF